MKNDPNRYRELPNPAPSLKEIGVEVLKALLVAICYGVIIGTVLVCTSCGPAARDESAEPSFLRTLTAKDVEKFAEAQGLMSKQSHERAIENLRRDHKEALAKGYWRGAKDQAISQAQLRPLYITEFRDDELLLYEVTERFPDTLPTKEAKAAANPPKEMKAQKADVR